MTQIVLASHNLGKIQEFQQLLMPYPAISLIPQAQLAIGEIAETGLTFVENALLKARHAAQHAGSACLADDSGLVVAALNGAPGIYSARYAGPKADMAENRTKLLAELQAVPAAQRHAYFYCVLVYLRYANDPAPIICEGRWPGFIAEQMQGDQGFGYDPLFFLPSHNCTAAQLPPAEKNRLSHRGQAVTKLLEQLKQELGLSAQ